MRENGIRVNAVAPPITYTPFLPTQGFTSEIANGLAASTPINRFVQPVELSRLYVGLVDNAQTYTYGATWQM